MQLITPIDDDMSSAEDQGTEAPKIPPEENQEAEAPEFFSAGDQILIPARILNVDTYGKVYAVSVGRNNDKVYVNADSAVKCSDSGYPDCDSAYEAGMEDSWKLADRIVGDPDDSPYILNFDEVKEVFRCYDATKVFSKYSAKEARKMLEEWDKTAIRIGEIVYDDKRFPGVVLKDCDAGKYGVLWSRCREAIYEEVDGSKFKKANKSMINIPALLQYISEAAQRKDA